MAMKKKFTEFKMKNEFTSKVHMDSVEILVVTGESSHYTSKWLKRIVKCYNENLQVMVDQLVIEREKKPSN